MTDKADDAAAGVGCPVVGIARFVYVDIQLLRCVVEGLRLFEHSCYDGVGENDFHHIIFNTVSPDSVKEIFARTGFLFLEE